MKTLVHNGVYIPHYNFIGLSVRYKEKNFPLTPLAEQLTIQFVKKFDTDYIKDSTFVGNFLLDLAREIKVEDHCTFNTRWLELKNWDFTDVQEYISDVKTKTEEMTKEDKKVARELGKKLREKMKSIYGYATMDGKQVSLMNWAAEPASIFMSKGKNPTRGHWKRPVDSSDITLNRSSSPKIDKQKWKEIIWKPKETWVASWKSPLNGKMKYVWFSQASAIRQEREKKKFLLASNLKNDIGKLESHIEKALEDTDVKRRKLATIVYLIKNLAIRVGDEKIAGENGTVGCTTLKKENVRLEGRKLFLSFVGKDYVQWNRELEISMKMADDIKGWMVEAGEDFIFKGLGSEDVSKFLREVIPGLSAKVFRTYIAGETWDENAGKNGNLINENTSVNMRKYLFKMTNLAIAQKLNHKKALPKQYTEKLIKREEEAKIEEAKLESLYQETLKKKDDTLDKKIKKQELKAEKKAIDCDLLKKTAEWNLGTSLASYIDPNKVVTFAKDHLLEIKDVYPKGLQEKYSWAAKKDEE